MPAPPSRRPLFRLFGIPVYIDPSWFIILALLTLTLARVFPVLLEEFYPGVGPPPPWQNWALGLLTALAFFGCILLHEAGHALAARTQQMRIEGITLFLFGGVADLRDEPPSAKAEFVTAVGGPVVSLVLAGFFALLAWAGYGAAWPPTLVIALGYLAFINVMVLVFNLTPAFPLDGGRVLRSILWSTTGSLRVATRRAAWVGRCFAWLLIAWGVVQWAGGAWLGGVWTVLVGLFLVRAAEAGYEQVLIREALQGEPVRRFMTPDPVTVPPALDLRSWVENVVYPHQRKAFPVVSDGRLEGYVETEVLGGLPPSEWERRTVAEVMRRDLADLRIAPDADALAALVQMERAGTSRLLVVEGDRLVGILSLRDLLRFLTLRLELASYEDDGPPQTPAHGMRDRAPGPQRTGASADAAVFCGRGRTGP